uniref:Large ribosomal subunit protein mL46 N-terminal domain-containing protein n=1 Tax=Tetradesmus obliquus TaxID=3088 RepID=A0A383V7P6_TETOB|eukprot:jgi/Sobl393_1/17904/SZX60960.1
MAFAGRSVLQQLVSQQRALQAALSGNLLQPAAGWPALQTKQQAYSTSSESKPAADSPRRPRPSIFAACVLERLPVVKSPPPAWEAEYKAWTQLRQMNEQLIKQYPALDKKQKTRDDSEQGELKLVPTVTKADESGAASTMKRRLADKLVLLVKARNPAAAAAAAAAAGSVSGAAAATAAAAEGQAVWTFPTAEHKAGESIKEAAERALKEAIGPSQVYFVGNSPMAHLDLRSTSSSSSSSSSSSAAGSPSASTADAAPSSNGSSSSNSSKRPAARVFFHLAQVVNDPWEVSLQESSSASELAWVGKEELGQYLQDEALLALARKML